MNEKGDEIVGIMHRLGLQILENGLLTFAVLEELYDFAYQVGQEEAGENEEVENGIIL